MPWNEKEVRSHDLIYHIQNRIEIREPGDARIELLLPEARARTGLQRQRLLMTMTSSALNRKGYSNQALKLAHQGRWAAVRLLASAFADAPG